MYNSRYTSFPRLLLVLLTGWGMLTLPSCTKNFKDFNTNGNGLYDSLLALDHVGLGAFFPQLEKNVVIAANNTGDAASYQVAQNLNADIFSGYMGTPTAFGGGKNNSNYQLNPGWDNAPFNNAFNNVMPAWYQIQQRAAKTVPDFYAVANIIKVEAMHRVTDVYGPLPYTRFGGGGFSVPYDAQDAIYNAFFSELDSAITTLTAYVQANPGKKPLANFDLVYGGDYVKWIRFANSLKLRLAMRIAYANSGLARQEAEAAVGNSYGVITDNSGNANLQSGNGIVIHHPLFVIDFNYGDIRAGAFLQSILVGYNDPRLPAYMLPSTAWPGIFIGVRNGIDIVNKSDREGYSDVNIQDNTPIQWMTASEVCFLQAEGVLRGWNTGGQTAQQYYEKGIQASFSQHGLGSAASYIVDSTSKPAGYTDSVNTKVNSIAPDSSILSKNTIHWKESDDFETKLERIVTQKWIAIFPEGMEAWSEFRRTGYPRVFPVVVNYSGNTIDTKIQIRRLPFPQIEYQTDQAQVQAAIGLLGGGPDNGGTRLWWDKKP